MAADQIEGAPTASKAATSSEPRRRRRPRVQSFRTDPRLQREQTATCADYSKHRVFATKGDPKKNFQARGHTVPDADFRVDPKGQAYTYDLSNMTPQWQAFNGGIWSALEGFTLDWAKQFKAVQVFSGSVFDADDDGRPDAVADADLMKPTKRVGVSSHYYRIIVRDDDGTLQALAFLLPHWKTGRPPGPKEKPEVVLTQHLTSIQEIRLRTGVDLFPDLEDEVKQVLEPAVASELWPRN